MILDTRSPQLGGLKALAEAALPSMSSAAFIFSAAPAGCVGCTFTVRGIGVTMTFVNGSTPTANANGTDYDVNTYDFQMAQAGLQLVQAVQWSGGAATGYVTYWGLV